MRAIEGRLISKRFFSPAVAIAATLLLAAVCLAGEGEKLSATDLSAKKAALEKELAKTFKLLSATNLQAARESALNLEVSLEEIRGSLTKAELTPFTLRIDKINMSIAKKEDSLVNLNLKILRTDGTDAAFEFMQNVAWKHGVSREKLDMIENSILGEAPAMEQEQESATLERTVQQLENKEPTDPNVDPYILKTAQMMVQARADSIARLQQAEAPAVKPEEKKPPQVAVAPAEEKPVQPQPIAPKVAAEPPKPVQEKPVTPATAAAPAPQPPVAKPAPEPPKPALEKPAAVAVATPSPEPAAKPEPPAVTPAPKTEEQIAMVTPAPAVEPPAAKPAVPAPAAPKPQTYKKPEEYTSPAIAARIKANQEFLKQYKAEKEKAQNLVVDLYNLIEGGQNPEAFKLFREKRAFLAKYVSTQVFNVLELTLAQNAIDAQTAANASGVSSQQAAKPRAPELDIIKRIEALSRDNRVEAAHAEFKRSELRLKSFMPKDEFKQLKDMVERSYKLRAGEPKKK